MSAPSINVLFDILGLPESDSEILDDLETSSQPFRSYAEMYDCIDESTLGNVPWQCMKVVLPDGLDPQTTP